MTFSRLFPVALIAVCALLVVIAGIALVIAWRRRGE